MAYPVLSELGLVLFRRIVGLNFCFILASLWRLSSANAVSTDEGLLEDVPITHFTWTGHIFEPHTGLVELEARRDAHGCDGNLNALSTLQISRLYISICDSIRDAQTGRRLF